VRSERTLPAKAVEESESEGVFHSLLHLPLLRALPPPPADAAAGADAAAVADAAVFVLVLLQLLLLLSVHCWC
jgi:hypothetical protein